MPVRYRRVSLLLTVALLLSLGAGSSAGTLSVEEAQREGKVVWYTVLAVEEAQALAADFERRYGIEVEVVRDGSGPLFDRYMEETAAGVARADILDTANAGSFVYLQREGLLARLDLTADEWVPEGLKHSGYWYTWRVSPIVAVYNPGLAAEAAVPASWWDFLDPQWRGHIANGHPDYSGSVLTAVFGLAQELGWEFFEGLARQDMWLGQSIHDGPEAVAAGRRTLSLMAEEFYAHRLKQAGHPVELLYPAEGVPLVANVVAVAHNAPHPHAARLFVEYLFSLETQQRSADEFNLRVLHPDVQYPAGGLPAFSDLNVIIPDPQALWEHADQVREQFVRVISPHAP